MILLSNLGKTNPVRTLSALCLRRANRQARRRLNGINSNAREAGTRPWFAMVSMSVCLPTAALTIIGICMLLFVGRGSGSRDFVSYWSAGQLLANHSNPYDDGAVLKLERAAGYPKGLPSLVMRNPPSALLLVWPLGFVGSRTGAILWAWLLLACLFASVRLVWIMNGRPRGYAIVLGYTFGPALACLLAGQTALFALLGLVLFIRLHDTRPFLAGVSLWLCCLKPHLFLPFAVVLSLWVVTTRSYKLLLGTLSALTVSSAIAFRLDPSAWAQYSQMMHHSGLESEFIPCLGVALRQSLHPGSAWLQYVPTAVACTWAARRYWLYRGNWDWMEQGAVLVLVSLIAAPYAWFSDQVLAIPALLQGAYRSSERWMLGVLALLSATAEFQILSGPAFHSAIYLCYAPAWLAWYLYATAQDAKAATPPFSYIPQQSDRIELPQCGVNTICLPMRDGKRAFTPHPVAKR